MKVVVITGAAQGIGRATAERFLANGDMLVASDVSAEGLSSLQMSAPERVATLVQDITEDSAPDEAIALAMQRFGRLDVLVNNAGIGRAKSIGDTTDDELDRFLNVNLRAQIRFSRSAVRVMTSGAAVVNMASIAGLRGIARNGIYSVAKAGMVGLTRQMAADYGPMGIRVNAVAPGIVKTPLTRERIENDPAFRRLHVDTTPFPRIGLPEDIAAAVAFLASEDASFISGHILVVDGGWLAANSLRD